MPQFESTNDPPSTVSPIAPRLAEVTHCQICDSSQSRTLFRDGPFRVVRCLECNLAYVTPRLQGQALSDVYGPAYWQSAQPMLKGYATYTGQESLYLKTFRRRARLLDAHLSGDGKKILDVGCAAGYFLRVMHERGHRVFGIELSQDIARHAIEHLGEEQIHVGTIEELSPQRVGFEPGSFDLATLWDVVEHVPDPQRLLQHVRQLLRPDGRMILETQNINSPFARLLGKRWQHFKHEEHLYHFDPKTVARLLDQAGFEIVSNSPSYGGKYVNFAFVAERARRLPWPLGTVMAPLRLAGKANVYLNFRDEMVIVAKPKAS